MHTSTHISYKISPDCSLPSTKYKLGNLPGFVTKGTYFFKEVWMERWRKWCLSTKNPRATWGSCFLSLSWAFLNIWQLNGRTSGNYLGLDGGWEGWPSNAAKSLASRVRNNCSPKFFHSSKAHREHNWLRELRHEKLNPQVVQAVAKVTSMLKGQTDKCSVIPLTFSSPWGMSRFSRGKATSLWAKLMIRKVKVLVVQSYPTLCNLIGCSPPGSLSMEFSRQEYRSG